MPVYSGARRAMRSAVQQITYLLYDRFDNARAAPLPSPRASEPGPGSLAFTDASNVMSVASGVLQVTGTPAAISGWVSSDLYARSVGRALIISFPARTTNGLTRFGWNTVNTFAAVNQTYNATFGTDALRGGEGTTAFAGLGLTVTNATPGQFMLVMRGTGAFILGRAITDTLWTLLWVAPAGTAGMYARMSLAAATAVDVQLDDVAIRDLGAPWTSDYGLATSRLAGARAAADTFTHTANALVEWVVTTLPASGNQDVHLRKQDASNYWLVRVTSDGKIELFEVVATVATSRGSFTGVANGHRVVVGLIGTSIVVISNTIQRFSYTSATSFATATAGEVASLGTSGALADVVAWPRTVPLVSA